MSFLTVATAPGAQLCKTVTADGTPEPVPALPYLWTFRARKSGTTLELFDLLSELRSRRDCIVVRGAVAPGIEQPCRRLSEPDVTTGDPASLLDLPQAWACLDFDSISEPDGLTGLFPAEPADFAAWIVEQLPAAFRGVSYVWRASGSAGFKPGIRLHLWFLLEIPVTGAQLALWLADYLQKGAPLRIDGSLFRTAQPHFTADPALQCADPMSARIGYVPGTPAVAVPAFEPAASTSTAIVVHSSTGFDPLTARALAAWNTEHSDLLAGYHSGSTRYECPACGSSDGLAVRPDGRWNCHGNKHAELDPAVGTLTDGGVFVGLPCEFLEQLPAGTLGRWLRERYPQAATFRASTAAQVHTASIVDVPPPPPESIDMRDVLRAQKRLEAGRKILKSNRGQLSTIARDLGRYVPHYLARTQVEDMCIEACTNGSRALARPDIEAVLATAIDAGTLDQWRPKEASGLARNELGGVERCYANVLAICGIPEIAGVLGWDTRAGRTCVMSPPPWRPDDLRTFPRAVDDPDLSLCVAYVSDVCDYAYCTPDMIRAAFNTLASDRPFDPVCDYLNTCTWDGTEADAREFLQTFWIAFANVQDTPYARAASLRWFIACVQRAFEPGCIHREVLTLLSDLQDVGKSNAFEALCKDRNWFLAGMQIDGTRDNMSMLRGKWLVCLDEIDRNIQRDRTGVFKNFISVRQDTYRQAYAHTEQDVLRSFAWCATTNERALFRDQTGNSRINMIDCRITPDTPIDFAAIAEMRDLVWGAARLLYLAGEPSYLQRDEKAEARAVQAQHMDVSDSESAILELWHAGPPKKAAGVHYSELLGFDPYADQLNGETWHYLTAIQLQQHCKWLGQRYNAKRSAGVLRAAGLHYGRLVRVQARRQTGVSVDPERVNDLHGVTA